MSPRLASAITISPAAVASATSRSSCASPDEPCRSKKATCGLITGTAPAKASTHVRQKAPNPVASSVSPHDASSEADGSMPAHSGPVARTAASTRSPKLSAISSSFVQQWYACGCRVGGSVARANRAGVVDFGAASRVVPDLADRRRVGVTPTRQLAEHLPRCPRVPEDRRPDLDGVGTGHEQLDRVGAGRHPTDPDDRHVGEGGPALPHGPHRDRVDGGAGQPTPARAQRGLDPTRCRGPGRAGC